MSPLPTDPRSPPVPGILTQHSLPSSSREAESVASWHGLPSVNGLPDGILEEDLVNWCLLEPWRARIAHALDAPRFKRTSQFLTKIVIQGDDPLNASGASLHVAAWILLRYAPERSALGPLQAWSTLRPGGSDGSDPGEQKDILEHVWAVNLPGGPGVVRLSPRTSGCNDVIEALEFVFSPPMGTPECLRIDAVKAFGGVFSASRRPADYPVIERIRALIDEMLEARGSVEV